MQKRNISAARARARFAAPILILVTWTMLAGAAVAQTRLPAGSDPGTSRFGGYMRMVSASGHVIAGESTDPAYNRWIPLRQTTMPSPAQTEAIAAEDPSAKAVHPPVVVVKDRDSSSLCALGRLHQPAAFSGSPDRAN